MLFMYFAVLRNPEDEPLFEAFYNNFYDTIYYISKEHLHTNENAEDCAHEVLLFFAKEFHNISHDFTDKRLQSYVKVVTKCMAIDMYRKEKKHINNVVDTDISEFYDLSAEDFDVFDEVQLKEAIDKMPEEYRYAFYLKYVYNMTGKETAKMLNISESLARKKHIRGKQFIIDFLKEDE